MTSCDEEDDAVFAAKQRWRSKEECPLFYAAMGRRTNIAVLVFSIVVGIASAVVMGIAVLSDFWERIGYSSSLVESLVANSSAFGDSARVEDLFGGNVIVVVNETSSAADDGDAEEEEGSGVVYLLLRMHAGLWTLCVDLTEAEYAELEALFGNATTYPPIPVTEGEGGGGRCIDQMEKQARYIEEFPDTNINIIRMRNLSISCSLVSLIILGASLVVFWIGLIEREVPPVLVVSVLYLLSALFSTFSILLALYRRRPRHLPNNADGTAPTAALLVIASFFFVFMLAKKWAPGCENFSVEAAVEADMHTPLLDDLAVPLFLPARTIQASWSLYLGLAGVGLCVVSSVSIYVLSRLMRTLPFQLC